MERINTHLGWAVVLSQLTHIFCCGLPALFSVMSLLSGVGLIGIMPSSLNIIHEALHAYEIPVLIMSGILLAIGWVLYAYSRKLDCTKTAACSHAPCAPKKKKSSYILFGATALFVMNVIILVFLTH